MDTRRPDCGRLSRLYRRGEENLGSKYAAHVGEIVEKLRKENRRATFLAETLPSVAGQIVFPPNYLLTFTAMSAPQAESALRTKCRSDLGGLARTSGIRNAGRGSGYRVFGKRSQRVSFGGCRDHAGNRGRILKRNGVFQHVRRQSRLLRRGACCADILRDENLQQNAKKVGDYWLAGLAELQRRHEILGDTRGSGLFLGLDLVRNRETHEPATAQASYVVNRLRECGILAGTDGPHHNVIKLRPPLIFTEADADFFNTTLEAIFAEDPAKP